MQSRSGRRTFTGADAWERIGITEHLGGIYATRELIGLCGIRPGQLVLDIGCGTGFTACLLAKEYGAQVMAAGVDPGLQPVGIQDLAISRDAGPSYAIMRRADRNLLFALGSVRPSPRLRAFRRMRRSELLDSQLSITTKVGDNARAQEDAPEPRKPGSSFLTIAGSQ